MFGNTLYDITHRMPLLKPDAGGGEAGAETEGGEKGGASAPTFDEALKNPAYQAEFDRRVTKALQTAQDKWQKDADARILAAKTEAEKLARMTAEQKAEHERQEREKSLADRETALTVRELRAQAAETLSQKGLPAALLDVLAYSDADKCAASIDAAEKAFRAAVQTGVEERMKGTPPIKGAGGGASKDAYEKLALEAQAAGQSALCAHYTRLAQEQKG